MSGTTHDLVLFLLALGTLLFTLGTIASAVEKAPHPLTIVYGVLAILFVYLLYRFSQKWRRPKGQDFNL